MKYEETPPVGPHPPSWDEAIITKNVLYSGLKEVKSNFQDKHNVLEVQEKFGVSIQYI